MNPYNVNNVHADLAMELERMAAAVLKCDEPQHEAFGRLLDRLVAKGYLCRDDHDDGTTTYRRP